MGTVRIIQLNFNWIMRTADIIISSFREKNWRSVVPVHSGSITLMYGTVGKRQQEFRTAHVEMIMPPPIGQENKSCNFNIEAPFGHSCNF